MAGGRGGRGGIWDMPQTGRQSDSPCLYDDQYDNHNHNNGYNHSMAPDGGREVGSEMEMETTGDYAFHALRINNPKAVPTYLPTWHVFHVIPACMHRSIYPVRFIFNLLLLIYSIRSHFIHAMPWHGKRHIGIRWDEPPGYLLSIPL